MRGRKWLKLAAEKKRSGRGSQSVSQSTCLSVCLSAVRLSCRVASGIFMSQAPQRHLPDWTNDLKIQNHLFIHSFRTEARGGPLPSFTVKKFNIDNHHHLTCSNSAHYFRHNVFYMNFFSNKRQRDGGADRSLSSLLLMLSIVSIDTSQYGTRIKFPSDFVCVYFVTTALPSPHPSNKKVRTEEERY